MPTGRPSPEDAFHQRMLDLIRESRAIGYPARRSARMIQEMGGLATARALIFADEPGDGFTAMWGRGRLDLTIEYEVQHSRWDGLFADEPELRERARRRLADYGYQP